MHHRLRILFCLLILCSCATPHELPPLLPENVAAEPRGIVGIIAAAPTSHLAIALRAIGVPHRTLAAAGLDDAHLSGLSLVLVDENAMAQSDVPLALPRIFDHARTMGIPVVVFAQNPETTADAVRTSAAPFHPRLVGYDVSLVASKPGHRVLNNPNVIGTDDLEAFSIGTRQLARGRNAVAILSGNADRPDSSAGLLRTAYGKGSVWYVAFEIIRAAADGHPSAQRLLANIASLRSED